MIRLLPTHTIFMDRRRYQPLVTLLELSRFDSVFGQGEVVGTLSTVGEREKLYSVSVDDLHLCKCPS